MESAGESSTKEREESDLLQKQGLLMESQEKLGRIAGLIRQLQKIDGSSTSSQDNRASNSSLSTEINGSGEFLAAFGPMAMVPVAVKPDQNGTGHTRKTVLVRNGKIDFAEVIPGFPAKNEDLVERPISHVLRELLEEYKSESR